VSGKFENGQRHSSRVDDAGLGVELWASKKKALATIRSYYAGPVAQ
jgi:hypothetical protein